MLLLPFRMRKRRSIPLGAELVSPSLSLGTTHAPTATPNRRDPQSFLGNRSAVEATQCTFFRGRWPLGDGAVMMLRMRHPRRGAWSVTGPSVDTKNPSTCNPFPCTQI